MCIISDKFLNPFEDHKIKSQNLNLARRYTHIDARKAERCASCGTYLAFALYKNIQTQELKRILSEANFCKIRFCPMCAWLKAKKQISYFYRVFRAIEANYSVRYIQLNLTIPNAPLEALNANLKHMGKAWSRLVKRKAFTNSVLGFIRAIEFIGDKTPSNECHPHYHCLLVVPSSYFVYASKLYIPKTTWANLWQKSLKVDFMPIVYVQTVKPKRVKKVANVSPSVDSRLINNALLSSLLECVKYSVKPAKIARFSQAQFEILDNEAKGSRQYDSGGIVKEYQRLGYGEASDDALDSQVWEYLKTQYFKWCGLKYRSDEVLKRND